MYEPANISVIPAAYVVTDEEIGFDNYTYTDTQASIEATFSNMDDTNSLELFGIQINKSSSDKIYFVK